MIVKTVLLTSNALNFTIFIKAIATEARRIQRNISKSSMLLALGHDSAKELKEAKQKH